MKKQYFYLIVCISLTIQSLSYAKGWTEHDEYSLPTFINVNDGLDNGVRFLDLNNDGRIDAMQNSLLAGKAQKGAWLNNLNGWTYNTTFTPPPVISTDGQDNGVRIIKTSNSTAIVQNASCSSKTERGAWLLTEQGWKQDSYLPPPAMITVECGVDNGVRFVDLNGDGSDDMVWASYNSYENKGRGVWLNSNDNWVQSSHGLPQGRDLYVTIMGQDNGVRFERFSLGVNNNAVVLLYNNGENSPNAWFYTTNGWNNPTTQLAPPVPITVNGGKSNGVVFTDFSGDGLPDILHSFLNDDGTTDSRAWVNMGESWEETDLFTPPSIVYFALNGQNNNGVAMVDLNNDGLQDIVASYCTIGGKCITGIWLCTPKGWLIAESSPPLGIAKNNQKRGAHFLNLDKSGIKGVIASYDGTDENSPFSYKLAWLKNGTLTDSEMQN